MGRVLLAGESDESLQALLDARERRQFTALTEQDDERLRQRILEVRAQGWALVEGRRLLQPRSMAGRMDAPRKHRGGIGGRLSLGGPQAPPVSVGAFGVEQPR